MIARVIVVVVLLLAACDQVFGPRDFVGRACGDTHGKCPDQLLCIDGVCGEGEGEGGE
jgi:hypothetical protein